MTTAAEPNVAVFYEQERRFLTSSDVQQIDDAGLRVRCLPQREMRSLVTSLRSLADDGLCNLLVVTGLSNMRIKWFIRRFGYLQPRSGFTEYIGPLSANRAAVVLCCEKQRSIVDLARRAEWYRRLLEENGATGLIIYRYPVELPRENEFGRIASLQSEGGIEELFAEETPIWKRVIDVVLALVGLAFLLPLLLFTALMVKATSRGPILFRQRRTGRGGRAFTMYKFRSMYQGSETRQHELRHLNEQDGPAFKIKHDPRVTPLGRILRKTCIDELPQLWNVLRGEMSLVGPRPLPCHESAACAGWQRRRLNVTPGITCLWQMRGRTMVSFERWMQLDLEYIARRSLWFDLTIIAGTLLALFPSFRWNADD